MLKVLSLNDPHHAGLLDSFFRLRHEVCVKRLGWDNILGDDNREIDQFDDDRAVYLVQSNVDGEAIAGARMLNTVERCLLNEVFPELVDATLPRSRRVWEVTRLVVDHRRERLEGCGNVCGQLLCGLLDFGFWVGASDLVSVSDTRIERLLLRAGWRVQRLGQVIPMGRARVVAERQPLDPSVLAECRRRNGITESVLEIPSEEERRVA